jgi:hypothetical protein
MRFNARCNEKNLAQRIVRAEMRVRINEGANK